MKFDRPVVTRFAPSPTGLMHIGTARTALFNYLFTRQTGGKIILRIEDTDRERSKPEYEKNILDGLAWLGLDYDELHRQSERTDIYREQLQLLLDKNIAYVSQEEIKKEGDRPTVIRFKNPGRKITFPDLIHGEITFDTTELGDFVIAKDLDTPIFHFTNVVDDKLMGITHVIRGDDHIANTPRQILIMEAIGGEMPIYAHLPLILSPDRTKLSKRHGAWPVTDYRDHGYLNEVLINFIALLGWSPQAADQNEEILSKEKLIKQFDLTRVQKSGAVFNLDKLNWLNKEYLKRLSPDLLAAEVINHWLPERIVKLSEFSQSKIIKLVPVLLERIQTYGELKERLTDGEFDYFFAPVAINKELLKSGEYLAGIISLLEPLSENDFMAEKIKEAVWTYANEKGRGLVLWPMRVALTGQEKSPDPFIIAAILGKEETLKRLRYASTLV